MIPASSSNKNTPKLVWIVEDNLLVLNIVKNTIIKSFPFTKVVAYTSIYKAAFDLCKSELNDYPDTLILDYDYGAEGNVEYFLSFITFLNTNQNFNVILHSDTPEYQLESALASPLISKFIPKSTDLLPLLKAVGLN